MPISPLPNAAGPYGASLGRAGRPPHPGDDEPARFYLRRVRLDSGGYDSGGAYWGHAEPLWRFESVTGEYSDHLRAGSRRAAQAAIRRLMPNAAVAFFGPDPDRPAWIVAALPYRLDSNAVGEPCGDATIWECGTARAALRTLAHFANGGWLGIIPPGGSDLLTSREVLEMIGAAR